MTTRFASTKASGAAPVLYKAHAHAHLAATAPPHKHCPTLNAVRRLRSGDGTLRCACAVSRRCGAEGGRGPGAAWHPKGWQAVAPTADRQLRPWQHSSACPPVWACAAAPPAQPIQPSNTCQHNQSNPSIRHALAPPAHPWHRTALPAPLAPGPPLAAPAGPRWGYASAHTCSGNKGPPNSDSFGGKE